MKLNNKGWETGPMILMTLFLLVLLAFAWYYINVLYTSALKKNPVSGNSEYYVLVKNNLKESAEKYYNEKGLTGSVVLSYSVLKDSGYITKIQDFIDEACTGYVTVNDKVFKPYIKCRNYTSDGYTSDFE